DFNNRIGKSIRKATQSSSVLFRDKVEPLLSRNPRRRDETNVKELEAALQQQQAELTSAAAALRAVEYRDADVEEARAAGLAYVGAWRELLGASQACLERGDQWTDADPKGLSERIDAWLKERQAYYQLV